MFWLFAQALFDDAFRFRWWHSVLWASIVAIGLVCGLLLDPEHAAIAAPIRSFLTMQAVAFAALAGAQTLGSWRDDLVERRRRIRLFIVAAAAGYTIVTAPSGLLRSAPAPSAVTARYAGGLFAVVAWSMLRIPNDEALLSPASDEPSVAEPPVLPVRQKRPCRACRISSALMDQRRSSNRMLAIDRCRCRWSFEAGCRS
jgi:hypothetical protein